MDFVGTVWALLPPVIAIVLALITKEVYMSLFIGVVTGALLYTNFSPVGTIEAIFEVMMEKLGDSWNVGILIFLVFLGIIVALMTRAGGSAAYGKWAGSKIKTRSGALLSTFALGVVIFVDDYFNCLTVGNVMRPVTDKQKISRAKLAYIIDATAAPICIIAPISSWAAAVTGYTNGDGFSLFLQTIPFNLYAWLTILMVIFMGVTGLDYGPMKKFEENAAKGDLFSGKNDYENVKENIISAKGKVIDLVLPVIFLIASCIICMIYTGGFFKGTSFVKAFSESDASVGLAIGSIFALMITIVFYVVRRILSFKKCMDCLPEGFKAMVPAILILTFAWTLKNMTSSLGAAEYVGGIMKHSATGFAIFLPAVIFVVGCGLAFATGTSWGTFGILIPIVVQAFQNDYCHFSMYGRCSMWRPLLTNFRYNNYVISGSAVRTYKPCINTDTLRCNSCSYFIYHIHYRRCVAESSRTWMVGTSNWNCSYGRNSCGHKSAYSRKRSCGVDAR